MFNPLNLLQVSLITMGVVNATPICNETKEKQPILTTIKKETSSNYVSDYELYLEQTNYGTATFENVYVQEGYMGTDTEVKYNYLTTSNYLNIIGTLYRTITSRDINGNNRYYFQNYEKIEGNIDNTYVNVTQNLLLLQITPYNYNINTETEISISLNVQDWIDAQGNEIIVENKYILSNVYTTTQDWTTYINRQITSFSARNIVTDIKNVDNNFYYTQNSKIEQITDRNTILEYNINLTPNKTNYVAIQTIPVVKALYYDYATDTIDDFGTNVSTIPLDTTVNTINGIFIRGTNIIPQGGTYEVIDIPGLMWDILTMPFAFVSQAFNLTLFPNTPYQINIANLFLSIIAIVVFVWLISFFVKLKG